MTERDEIDQADDDTDDGAAIEELRAISDRAWNQAVRDVEIDRWERIAEELGVTP